MYFKNRYLSKVKWKKREWIIPHALNLNNAGSLTTIPRDFTLPHLISYGKWKCIVLLADNYDFLEHGQVNGRNDRWIWSDSTVSHSYCMWSSCRPLATRVIYSLTIRLPVHYHPLLQMLNIWSSSGTINWL